MNIFGGILLIIIGILVIIDSILKLRRIKFLKTQGIKSYAKIVAIEKIENDGVSYDAVFECETLSGFIVRDKISSVEEYTYRVGQNIEIYIDANDSTNYVINIKSVLIYEPITKIISGLIGIAIGFCLIIFKD